MINPIHTNTARIKFIDGLRAIAVLLVMLFHFYYQQISDAGAINVNPAFLQQIFQYGNMGFSQLLPKIILSIVGLYSFLGSGLLY